MERHVMDGFIRDYLAARAAVDETLQKMAHASPAVGLGDGELECILQIGSVPDNGELEVKRGEPVGNSPVRHGSMSFDSLVKGRYISQREDPDSNLIYLRLTATGTTLYEGVANAISFSQLF